MATERLRRRWRRWRTIPAADLRLDQIRAIRTLASVQIPDDALILREGDRPREHYKTIIVAAFLLVFAMLNLLALRSRA